MLKTWKLVKYNGTEFNKKHKLKTVETQKLFELIPTS